MFKHAVRVGLNHKDVPCNPEEISYCLNSLYPFLKRRKTWIARRMFLKSHEFCEIIMSTKEKNYLIVIWTKSIKITACDLCQFWINSW